MASLTTLVLCALLLALPVGLLATSPSTRGAATEERAEEKLEVAGGKAQAALSTPLALVRRQPHGGGRLVAHARPRALVPRHREASVRPALNLPLRC